MEHENALIEGLFRIKKRVLVVSDSPRVLAEVKRGLAERFSTIIASTEAGAIAAFGDCGADAVLVCVDAARGADAASFADLTGRAAARGIPALFLSERDDELDEASAFAMGASDYSVRRRRGESALINRLMLRISSAENERERSKETGGGSGRGGSAADSAGGSADSSAGASAAAFGAASAAASGENLEAALFGKTILIAEDVELNRDIMAAMLSEIDGLRLEFACDGAEAAAKFAQDPELYDLIFMDVNMPVKDGLESARIIRATKTASARDIPIVALSATIEEEDVARVLGAGMDGWLQKPADYESLVRVSAAYCSRPAGQRPFLSGAN